MLPTHKGEVPFLVLLLPFVAGICLGLYFHTDTFLRYIIIGLVFCCGSFLVLNLLYSRLKVYRYTWLGGIMLYETLVLAGWLCMNLQLDIDQETHFSKHRANYLLVRVTDEPKHNGTFLRFTAKVDGCINNRKVNKATGKLLITIVADSNSNPVNYGDELLIPANYKTVDPPFNPAEFNYKTYLAQQNIYHQSFLTIHQFVKAGENKGNPVIALSLRLRQHLVQDIKTNVHSPEASAIASTLLLGYKADLDPSIVQAYANTGTIHVLSVSGAHVAILFYFISLLLGFLKGNSYGRWLNTIISLSLIWGYAMLTGFSPAVCRAAVMISMLIIGKAGNRQAHALNTLAVSAFALLLYNPLLIKDIGFQLSYFAVAGLIVLQPIIYNVWKIENRWLDKLWIFGSSSLAAQIITFPLSAYYFHQFPVYFLISNLFIIIPSEIIMAAGMLFLASAPVPFVHSLLAAALQFCIVWMNKGLIAIENLPLAIIGKIWITPTEHLLLYMIILLFFYCLVSKKSRQLIMCMTCVLVLCISVSFKKHEMYSASSMTFLNLKKHSALVFTSHNRAVVITDVKPNDKTYQHSIQPYLDSLQIGSVDIIGFRQNFRSDFVYKQYNLVQYRNRKILIFDTHLQNIRLTKKLNTDYILITGSPQVNLNFICKNYAFKTMIIDANNSPQRTDTLMNEAAKLHTKIFCLKRNKALVVVSN